MATMRDSNGNVRCDCGHWITRIVKRGTGSVELKCRYCKRSHLLSLDREVSRPSTHLEVAGFER